MQQQLLSNMADGMTKMPLADWQTICNAVRAKLGSSDKYLSGELAAKILSIGGDAVGSALSVYIDTTGKYVLMPTADWQEICLSVRTMLDEEESYLSGDLAAKILSITGISVGDADTGQLDIPAAMRPESTTSGLLAMVERAKTARTNAAGHDYVDFLFITDVHWSANSKHSPDLIKYFKREVADVPLFFGGDAIEDVKATTTEGIADLQGVKTAFSGLIKMACVGNHDWNSSGKEKGAGFLEDSDVYDNLYCINEENPLYHVYSTDETITKSTPPSDVTFCPIDAGWYDDAANNVRYIQLNYQIFAENSDIRPRPWKTSMIALYDILNSMPEGYRAILVTHGMASAANKSSIPIKFNDSYANLSSVIGKLKLVMTGHIHNYRYITTTLGGVTIPEYATRNDSCAEKYRNTIDGQAICYVLVDFTTNKANVVEFRHSAYDKTFDLSTVGEVVGEAELS